MSQFYRCEGGKMVPDEKGIWTLRAQLDVTREALDAANNALAKVTAERDHLKNIRGQLGDAK